MHKALRCVACEKTVPHVLRRQVDFVCQECWQAVCTRLRFFSVTSDGKLCALLDVTSDSQLCRRAVHREGWVWWDLQPGTVRMHLLLHCSMLQLSRAHGCTARLQGGLPDSQHATTILQLGTGGLQSTGALRVHINKPARAQLGTARRDQMQVKKLGHARRTRLPRLAAASLAQVLPVALQIQINKQRTPRCMHGSALLLHGAWHTGPLGSRCSIREMGSKRPPLMRRSCCN